MPITTEEFNILNRCLDDAIAQAVTEHTRRREKAIVDEGTIRSGVLAHELRNRLSAASMGFHLIKRGSVAANGSTSVRVARNLETMVSIIQRSLVEVRLDSGKDYRETVRLAALVKEAEADSAMDALARNLTFTTNTIDPEVQVRVDRQVLAGAIANLVQNAFKFTRPEGHVALHGSATSHRVRIEIEDECGGLPEGRTGALFEAFRQEGKDRSGMGLGLFLSRKGVEANGGVLEVRDVPGHGCVFTVDLPRSP